MVDRIPLYPGRVKMTPVAGQANTYDMTRADDPTQAGTPLNKATLLKDATAALYGLGESAVPDDVLAALGKYKQYWWKRRSHQFVELQSPLTSKIYISLNYGKTLKVAKSITINQDSGAVSLKNPENFKISIQASSSEYRSMLQGLIDESPCYVTNLESDESGIYYLPSDSTLAYSSNDSATNFTICFYYSNETTNRNWFGINADVKAVKVSSQASVGDLEYVQSSNRNAYPDSGTQDGYEYEYLGIPFDNAVTAPKIETGSYVGTGTYGSGNKNTLTLSFAPLLLFITKTGTGDHYVNSGYILCRNGGHSGQNGNIESAVNGNTVTWYSGISAQVQLNTSGTTYAYIAIGKES